ncbi:MAG: hypothetical protein ACXAC7_08465 [Candidatus Hodarchaeales archaeon]|jgi:DNA-binding transcriptional ArsR family regulator
MDNNPTINELKGIKSELKLIRSEIKLLNEKITQLIDIPKDSLKFQPQQQLESPIDSTDIKSCMETLKIIKEYEKSEKKGVTAEIISEIRGLSRPTIYNHLKELQKSDLVYLRSGSIIGLKPVNANFYYSKEREPSQTLWNPNYLISLPKRTQRVALIVRNAGDKSITIEEINTNLKNKSDFSKSLKEIEKEIQNLLRQGLIDYNYDGAKKVYFAVGLIEEK